MRGSRFGLVLGAKRRLLWPQNKKLGDFEFLGGLETSGSYQVQPATEIKSYPHLALYPRKVFSAWTEVRSVSWPPTALNTASAGRDLDDF